MQYPITIQTNSWYLLVAISRQNDCNCSMYLFSWLMNLLPNLYCFIYLSLTSMMLLTILRNNWCIGASMNISTDTSVLHDCGISHLMLIWAHTTFCLAVPYTVSIIALFCPIECRYTLHCPLDQLTSLTSISISTKWTQHDNHSNKNQCRTRYCSFTVQFVAGSMFDICVVGYPCSSSWYLDALGWSYVPTSAINTLMQWLPTLAIQHSGIVTQIIWLQCFSFISSHTTQAFWCSSSMAKQVQLHITFMSIC